MFLRSARTMLANRISFALSLHGPSLALDTACSSSMYAFDFAYRSILTGECDAAIVGGVNLLLQPYLTLQFARFSAQITLFPSFLKLFLLPDWVFCLKTEVVRTQVLFQQVVLLIMFF